jgi:hypothetical protein
MEMGRKKLKGVMKAPLRTPSMLLWFLEKGFKVFVMSSMEKKRHGAPPIQPFFHYVSSLFFMQT